MREQSRCGSLSGMAHSPSSLSLFAALGLALAPPLAAQDAEPIDEQAVQILRRLGLEEGRVMEHLSWMCDVYGPRLTGSPNLHRAEKWAVDTLKGFGLSNAHLEEWGPFGRGWRLDEFTMRVDGDNPWPVLAWPKAWSPSLDGEVDAEVVNAATTPADALLAMDLSDKIVLLEPPRATTEWFDGLAERLDDGRLLSMADGTKPRPRETKAPRPPRPDFRAGFQKREAILNALRKNPPLMILDRSYKGDYGTVFVAAANAMPGADGSTPKPWQAGATVVPQATLAVEHYNRICRLLEKDVPVRLAVRLRTTFFDDDPMEHNVLAELPGADPDIGKQIVMLGAHFDSWHSATGATDNGAGSAVMIEAMRLLTALVQETGVKPRRTIRIGLWTGEEQGLLGSRAWVAQHLRKRGPNGELLDAQPELDRLSIYLNLDNGTGKIRGIYLQGNDRVAPIFRAWFRPFHDLDAATLTLGNTGGTDHLSFDEVGVPGFQFIQDPIAYGNRTHHSNMDCWDHAVEADLEQAATILASFAWHAAQRDAMVPRMPR